LGDDGGVGNGLDQPGAEKRRGQAQCDHIGGAGDNLLRDAADGPGLQQGSTKGFERIK
jgi:hypothetical protein